ncbi:MAG: hypothetical protein JG718_02565 [Candidatus Thiothrix moscowensis]|nr:hypothetical protein [Candidatus Thiothrix moscowensis]
MTLMERLKKHWIISTGAALIGATLYIAAAYGDLKTVITDIANLSLPPLPTLNINSTGDLHPGDSFTLLYEAPTEGYLSVWVHDAATGKVEKLLPVNGMGTLHLNDTNHTGALGLRVKPGSKGTDVYEVVWTPEGKPNHLSYSQYATQTAFNAELDTMLRNTDGARGERTNVPIYP